MAKEVVSTKQALSIAKGIKSMLKELNNMSSKYLLSTVPEDEKDCIFIQINQSKTNKMLIDIQLFNSLTKTVVIRSYTIIDLLRKCSSIFLINSIIKEDMDMLYLKSKEKIYGENTVIYV